jgi:hypothetical protein
MLFWSNFAKEGIPGVSTNGIKWLSYNSLEETNLLILDNRRNMRITNSYSSYKELVEKLNYDERVNELEKCVILYQMGTFVGNDIFNEIKQFSNFGCDRKVAKNFLKANANFIEY